MESETDFESDLTDIDSFDNSKGRLKLDSLKRHRCPYEGCHSAFNRPWKLDRHINTHTKNRPFKCDFDGCTKDYTNNSHLQRHKSISHSDKKQLPVQLDCPFPNCTKTFSNKWNLKKHCNLHKTSESHKCHLCCLEFRKHRHLKNHLSCHLGLKPFNCQTCQEAFQTKKELKRHERKHRVYKCDEDGCGEEFDKFVSLRKHMKIAHPKWLKCDHCGKAYLNKSTLTEHILTHLETEKRDVATCPYEDCTRYYFHQRNLNHHIRSYHQNINFKCTICEQTLVNRTKLKEHMRLHANSDKSKSLKLKRPRQPRKDKGLPRKSMTAVLSGIILPPAVDKNLAQNKITKEDVECIENVKKILSEEISTRDESVDGDNVINDVL